MKPARNPVIRSCSDCGCTDARACPGGCFWIGPNTCSACGKPPKLFLLLTATKVKRPATTRRYDA